MSRIGNNPVAVPDGVEIPTIAATVDGQGKAGRGTVPLHEDRGRSKMPTASITVCRATKASAARSAVGHHPQPDRQRGQGRFRRLHPAAEHQRRRLPRPGPGLDLNLQLGFSHDVKFPIPDGIKIAMEGDRGNVIAVSGIEQTAGRPGRQQDPLVSAAGALQGQGTDLFR